MVMDDALRPVVTALIPCLGYRDVTPDGPPSIIGVLGEVECSAFPKRLARFEVYIEASNIRRAMHVVASVGPLDRAERIDLAVAWTKHDPRMTNIGRAFVDGLVVNEPGDWIVDLIVEGETILTRKFSFFLAGEVGRPGG